MQFQPVTKAVEMFGINETANMTVASSAKVFYTLISGLYSRKIESICREIVSNAFDGHAKQGNLDRPFFVHAPTIWEPWFAVRDYGCSIDHETVVKNCTIIGWSSKESSNTEIGTWGYGMKSPFAYTSQFILTCWLDGEKRVYSYHIDESGTPVIALRDRLPSDEERGVEVRFDVKNGDIEAFRKAIRWVALPYKTCFKSNLEDVRSAQVTRDDGLCFLSPDADGPMVEIGPVWYHIDFNELSEVADIAHVFKFNELVIRSSIGELGIVPSRESLEYTPKTVANLTRLLKEAYEKLSKEVADAVSGATTIWEAAQIATQFRSGMGMAIAKSFKTQWGTLSHLDNFYFNGFDRGDVAKVTRLTTSVLKRNVYQFERSSVGAVFVFDAAMPMVHSPNLRMFRYMQENLVNEAVVIYLPDAASSIARWKANFKKNHTPRDERKLRLKDLWKTTTERRKNLLAKIEEFGCPVVLYQNQLPEPLRTPRAAGPIVVYEKKRGHSRWQPIDQVQPNPTETNIVFRLKDRETSVWFEERDLRRAVSAANDAELGQIVGVSSSNFSKFLTQNPEFVSSDDYFTTTTFDVSALEARINAINDTKLVSLHHEISEATRIGKALRELASLPEPVKRVLSLAEIAREKVEQQQNAAKALGHGLDEGQCNLILRLVKGSGIPASEPKTFPELENAIDALDIAYPELRELSHSFDRNKAMIHVLGIDALRLQQAVSFHDGYEDA